MVIVDMTEQRLSRFGRQIPGNPVEVHRLTEPQRFARRLLAEQTGHLPDDFARPEPVHTSQQKRLTAAERKKLKEHAEMEEAGFVQLGSVWYRPGKPQQSSESA